MPPATIDLERQLRRMKRQENFLGFAGVGFRLADGRVKDGVVKIAGPSRDEAGRCPLTLTFIVDVDGDEPLRQVLAKAFRDLDEDALRPILGRDFSYLVPTESGEGPGGDWFMAELTFCFRALSPDLRAVVAERLVPALSARLRLRFEDVVWWEESGPQAGFVDALMDFFRKRKG